MGHLYWNPNPGNSRNKTIMRIKLRTLLALVLVLSMSPTVGANTNGIQKGEMAGYLLVPNEKVPETYNAGFSMYVAAWPLLEKARIRNWNSDTAKVLVNGKPGDDVRLGFHQAIEGTDLVLFLFLNETAPVKITVAP